ncbi:MAG: RluA family pseudouridine synthase [Patescibacteria group bacterium]
MFEAIKILYEDKDYVVIDKPSGLVVHADGKTDEPVLTDWVLQKYPEAKGVGEPTKLSDGTEIDRPGIVHRIDRETSGVLVIAKNQKAHQALKEQFQERLVHKRYLAFVYGELKDKYGIINRPIGKSKSDFRKWSAQRGARGEMREAETWWELIASHDNFSLIEAEPKTGRTHQIRVHFTAINHPIVMDRLYAANQVSQKPNALGFNRTALHANSIEFTLMNGKKKKVSSPLPEDFKNALKEIRINPEDIKK